MAAKALLFVVFLVQIIYGLSAAPFFGAPYAATEFPCAAGAFGYGAGPFAFDGPYGYDGFAGRFGYGAGPFAYDGNYGYGGRYGYGPYGYGAALL